MTRMNQIRKTASIAIALAVGLSLGSCGGVGSDPADKPAAKTKNVRYETVDDLRKAFVKAGGDCPDWEQTDVVSAALESGNCSGATVISIYVDRSEAKTAADTLTKVGAGLSGEERSVLVGPNWIINNSDDDSSALLPLKRKLGGTIVTAY